MRSARCWRASTRTGIRSRNASRCSETVRLSARLPAHPSRRADIKLDSGFKEFFHYCKSQGIPLIIVSRYVYILASARAPDADPLCRAHTAGWSPSSARCSPTSSAKRRATSTSSPTPWTCTRTAPGTSSTGIPPGRYPISLISFFSHLYLYLRSGYGHDKSQAILPYRHLPDPPLLFFLGDGVSGERLFL